MYAIVDVKDKQFKVRENDTLYVPYHADAEIDETLTLDRVMLLSNGEGEATIGTPTVDGASVTARVVDHVKGDKVIVFKKKRRKRYRVKKGHRQQYTQIHIESLNADGAAPPPADDEGEAPSESEAASAEETAEAESADGQVAEGETAGAEATDTEVADDTTADAADSESTEGDETEVADADEEPAAEGEETEDDEPDDEEKENNSK